MKTLHRPDLYGWSAFDEARNVDFNGTVWARAGGSIVVDPMPLSAHDRAHLMQLGPVSWIVITNSDHTRSAAELAAETGAQVAAPAAERGRLDCQIDVWLTEGVELVPGLQVLELQGSKTPGELALVIEETTLITGDLVRGHRGGHLNLLPDAKLTDPGAAARSVQRLADLPSVEAVIVGDGWHIFRDGKARLNELAGSLSD